jgi:hypothetical protein
VAVGAEKSTVNAAGGWLGNFPLHRGGEAPPAVPSCSLASFPLDVLPNGSLTSPRFALILVPYIDIKRVPYILWSIYIIFHSLPRNVTGLVLYLNNNNIIMVYCRVCTPLLYSLRINSIVVVSATWKASKYLMPVSNKKPIFCTVDYKYPKIKMKLLAGENFDHASGGNEAFSNQE